MLFEFHGRSPSESHEQFVRRASSVFPEEQTKAWSRLERAVLNHLMAPLIHNHGYSAITHQMLLEFRAIMDKIVQHFEPGILESESNTGSRAGWDASAGWDRFHLTDGLSLPSLVVGSTMAQRLVSYAPEMPEI